MTDAPRSLVASLVASLAAFATAAVALSACACHDRCAPHAAGPSNAVGAPAQLFEPNPAPETLKVALPSTKAGVIGDESVFGGFGCSGKNQSLAVEWTGAPPGVLSYAVVVHDPDAPTGVGFFHWTVANIPAGVASLPLGASGSAMPAGAVEGYTDFGKAGYGGPCPPPGKPHRYVVTVYALDVATIPFGAAATGAYERFVLREHTLALGRATGTYGR